MDARISEVRPSLFIRTALDGDTWEFAATPDGGCALLCGGEVVTIGNGSEESVGRILGEFLAACGARRDGRFPTTAAPRPPDGTDGPGINPRAA